MTTVSIVFEIKKWSLPISFLMAIYRFLFKVGLSIGIGFAKDGSINRLWESVKNWRWNEKGKIRKKVQKERHTKVTLHVRKPRRESKCSEERGRAFKNALDFRKGERDKERHPKKDLACFDRVQGLLPLKYKRRKKTVIVL